MCVCVCVHVCVCACVHVCVHAHLLEVDALPTGIGSSEKLHSPVFQIQIRVIGNERIHHHLLQRVPTRDETAPHITQAR